jgi:HD-like signal output (HDOD) protein
MSGKKRYYPNNWQEYKDLEDDMFECHTFEEFMEWKVAGWELPSSVCCIIRVEDLETGKIKEHTYQRRCSARKKVAELIKTPGIEFVVCDQDVIHHVTQHELENEYENF